jgi:hypothetical protein
MRAIDDHRKQQGTVGAIGESACQKVADYLDGCVPNRILRRIFAFSVSLGAGQ